MHTSSSLKCQHQPAQAAIFKFDFDSSFLRKPKEKQTTVCFVSALKEEGSDSWGGVMDGVRVVQI